jgi:hypothetical protein
MANPEDAKAHIRKQVAHANVGPDMGTIKKQVETHHSVMAKDADTTYCGKKGERVFDSVKDALEHYRREEICDHCAGFDPRASQDNRR